MTSNVLAKIVHHLSLSCNRATTQSHAFGYCFIFPIFGGGISTLLLARDNLGCKMMPSSKILFSLSILALISQSITSLKAYLHQNNKSGFALSRCFFLWNLALMKVQQKIFVSRNRKAPAKCRNSVYVLHQRCR